MHLQVAKRIFQYLQGTVDFGLYYKMGLKSDLIGSTDSDFARDQDDRRSTSGYAFMLSTSGFNGCFIVFKEAANCHFNNNGS